MKVTTLPACAVEAEAAYLGALLLRGKEAYERGGKLASRCFFDHRHTFVFVAMRRLLDRDAPLDPVTVYEELGQRQASVGGMSFLGELLCNVGTADNVKWYASRIRETWMLRCLRNAAGELAISAIEDPSEYLMVAKKKFEELEDTWKEIR